jgi:VanZ family protein
MTPVVPSARHYAVLLAAFAAFVLYGSFVPFTTRPLTFDTAVRSFFDRMGRGATFESRSDWAANVILFVPLGFLAAGALSVDRRRSLAVLALIPAMTLFSAAMEFGQLWFPARTTSVNDVAAETLGGAIGVGLWLAVGRAATDRFRGAWSGLGPEDWAAKALPAYLLFLVIAHGMPFDLTMSPWQIYHKYKSGLEIDASPTGSYVRLYPHPQVIAEKTLLHFVYFVPVGALLAHLPGERWRSPGAVGRVLGAGLAIAGLIELVQLIVLSAGTYASDVILGAAFVLAGWKLATSSHPADQGSRLAPRVEGGRRSQDQGPDTPSHPPAERAGYNARAWLIGLATYTLALVLVAWPPFEVAPDRFADRLGNAVWLPFADYYAGNYLGAFNRILEKTLVFVPVGFLVARAWPVTARVAGLAGAALAVVIEIGQALMSDHSTSVSDVILGAVGATVGGLIAVRAMELRAEPNLADRPARNRFFY